MDRKENRTTKITIKDFLKEVFFSQALLTFSTLIFIAIIISLGSAKFSTDRFVRVMCSKISSRSRILIEANKTHAYQEHYKDLRDKLERKYPVRSISIEEKRPEYTAFHYPLGECSINWKNDLSADFYISSFWAGNKIYVKGTVSPKFFRSDILVFFVAICLLLFASYYWGTRRILRKIERKIIASVAEIWEGLRTGKEPNDLSLKEISDLWESVEEHKELERKKHRTEIARLYFHDLKRPVQFYSNRLKLIASEIPGKRREELLKKTIEQGQAIEAHMHKTLKKIATGDYARYMKACELRALAEKYLPGRIEGKASAWGDKTMLERIFENLISNALKASEGNENISVTLKEENSQAVIFVRNIVKKGYKVQPEHLFREGYSTFENGTGMGLSYCMAVVGLHGGSIEAHFSEDSRFFEIFVHLPSSQSKIPKSTP